MSENDLHEYNLLRERVIGDRRYELRGQCSCCNVEILEIWRWSGASFARYKLPKYFNVKDFQAYVDLLDEQFIQSSSELFAEFYRELQKKNSREGIEADSSFEFRLLEYGRQRASALDKLGYLEALVSDEPVTDQFHLSARLSFELGYAAAEHHVMTVYEDYLHDGVAMSEWRHAGQAALRDNP